MAVLLKIRTQNKHIGWLIQNNYECLKVGNPFFLNVQFSLPKLINVLMDIPVCVGYVADFSKLTSAYNRILNKLSRTDLFSMEQKRLYEEAFFIKHFAEWESMVYNLFTYSIAVDTAALAEHIGLKLPKKLSIDNAHAILNGLHFTPLQIATNCSNWQQN